MIKFTIDGTDVELPAGSTILDGARKLGISIPTLCSVEHRKPQTSCMVCLVKVEGESSLVPACAFKAEEGMKVKSSDPAVREARKTALELLLSEHGGDCLGPCHTLCPAWIDVPLMIDRISAGFLHDAVAALKDKIPFPAVLGRICPAPCEKGCRRGAHDSAVSIRLLERFAADADLASTEPFRPSIGRERRQRAAIVGAGPAGLAAAYFLRKEGYGATVIDDHDLPGGMLRYGVPEELLPRAVLDRELHSLEDMGIEFRMGLRLGVSLSLDELKNEFDSLLIATGPAESGRIKGGFLIPGVDEPLTVNRNSCGTGLPGVFAAGGLLRPGKLAVRAMAQGRLAARSIASYLADEEIAERDRPFTTRLGKLGREEMNHFLADASRAGRTVPEDGEAGGFTGEEARDESLRCLKCNCSGLEKCRLRRCSIEYGARVGRYQGDRRRTKIIREHPGLVFDPGKCILCGLCIQISDEAAEQLGLTFSGRGFDVTVTVPFNRSLAESLLHTASECVSACPTGAMVLK